MRDGGSLSGQMRSLANVLIKALPGEQRELAARLFTDDVARRWIEYRPLPRPGARLADMSLEARKAAHQLLATGLSEHTFAQAMGIIALEEVLDLRERGQRGRHGGNYWVSVYGDPAGGDPWSWRFEGHHLSVTMTVAGDEVSPAPVFLGANPACVAYHGRAVSRPLAPEEDMAREVLSALNQSSGRPRWSRTRLPTTSAARQGRARLSTSSRPASPPPGWRARRVRRWAGWSCSTSTGWRLSWPPAKRHG